jgi:preprotein translocase subunit YajC
MAIFNVTNATQLQGALASAQGGDRIVLAAGNYGTVKIANRDFGSEVTVQAAQVGTSVRFDGLQVNNSKNLTFRGMDVGRALNDGEPDWTQLSTIRDSSNIKLSFVRIHGSEDGNPANDGVGLEVSNVHHLNVSNSSFSDLRRGIFAQKSSFVVIQSNELKTIREDGLSVAAVDNIVIDKNRFSEFQPNSTDHSDFIQFFNTNQTKGSSNITIKNNVMTQSDHGGTNGTQGIWMSDPASFGYKNLLIQNNLIWSNDMHNGITVRGGDLVRILGNTVLSKADDAEQLWIRLENSSRIVLEGNITDNILVNNVTSLVQLNNVNFTATPDARSLVPQLNAPASAQDLMVAGIGYKGDTLPQNAPVSTAAGSSIGGLLSRATGASLGKIQVAESADQQVSPTVAKLHPALVEAVPVEAPALPKFSEIFAVQEPTPPLHHVPTVPMHVPFHAIYDHFAALP